MQKTKILITALALTLCTLSFASCGNGNVEESGSTAPGSTTESATKETESRVETTTERPGTTTTERPGTTSTESTQGTTGANGTTESMTESSGGTTNTTGSETTAPESGSVTDSIGDDVRRGADNVKNGVKDFFGMDHGEHDGMKHRPRVPYGK